MDDLSLDDLSLDDLSLDDLSCRLEWRWGGVSGGGGGAHPKNEILLHIM